MINKAKLRTLYAISTVISMHPHLWLQNITLTEEHQQCPKLKFGIQLIAVAFPYDLSIFDKINNNNESNLFSYFDGVESFFFTHVFSISNILRIKHKQIHTIVLKWKTHIHTHPLCGCSVIRQNIECNLLATPQNCYPMSPQTVQTAQMAHKRAFVGWDWRTATLTIMENEKSTIYTLYTICVAEYMCFPF